MAASRSRRASADRVHATLFLALSGLSCVLVSADASADACPAPIAVTQMGRRRRDARRDPGSREPLACRLRLRSWRRVAVSGIRLEVESSRVTARATATRPPCGRWSRPRREQTGNDRVADEQADATTWRRRGTRSRQETASWTRRWSSSPRLESVAAASWRRWSTSTWTWGYSAAPTPAPTPAPVAESAAISDAVPLLGVQAPSARHDALVVEVFATETETRPRATLRVRLALRGGSPFLSHGHGLTSLCARETCAPSARGRRPRRRSRLRLLHLGVARSLRSTPVLVATCVTLAFLVECARAAVRACLEVGEARARAAAGAAARGERDDSESSVTLLRSARVGHLHR